MEKTDYRKWLPELKSMTLFQDIEDNDIIALLEAMAPKVIHMEAADKPTAFIPEHFRIFLKRYPAKEQEPRRFKWDMPKFEEPGAMMGEIPSLSLVLERLGKTFAPPHAGKPRDYACDLLEVTPDMLVKYYNARVYPAQSVMLRNFLGILAQKVMDVRQELFKARCGVDIYNLQAGDEEKLWGAHK